MEDLLTSMDPETEFLASKRQTGNEWELFKENVRPLKRGRKVELLNEALKSQSDNVLRKSLLEKRRRLIEAIDEYKGEDPLQPWLECIKWVQESFPAGGEYSGLIVIYEQCVRMFWHDERYKDDLRYLKVWLEYAETCSDADVIYSFLEANRIGHTHAIFYTSYALFLESKNKIRSADDIFSLGTARNAQPLENIESVYRKFLARSAQRNKIAEDESAENPGLTRGFGTVLTSEENRRQIPTQRIDPHRKKALQRVDPNTCISVYKDGGESLPKHRLDAAKSGDARTWHILGTQSNRNKENTPLPSKWTSLKIPQKPGSNIRPAASAPRSCLEIFVDEECADELAAAPASSTVKLKRIDEHKLRKESELLKDNPLRNFPSSCLLRLLYAYPLFLPELPPMAGDLSFRWRRVKGFRLNSSKFSVLRLRLRLLGLIGLLKRCLLYLEKGDDEDRRRRRRLARRWGKKGSRRGLPEGKLWPAGRSNSFSAEAIAECVEFIKRTSVSVDSDAPP